MDEEIKNLLKENLEVSKKSLEILEKTEKAKRIGLFLKIIYWGVLISIIFLAYYFAHPYFATLRQLLEVLKNLQNFKLGM